jgi:glutathione S-transferase
MDTLTLYTNPMSRGRIARWMMEELGQPYTTVLLDFGTTMKAPHYLAINPMGKVPAITHGSRVVTECAAICTYLADAFPEAGLMPADRSAFYRWMFFAAGPLEASVTDRALGVEVPAERRGMVGYGSFDNVVDTLERAVSSGPYICGADFSAADVYVGAQIGWGLRFGTIPARPAFSDYWDRISARPALARANALNEADMPRKEAPHG